MHTNFALIDMDFDNMWYLFAFFMTKDKQKSQTNTGKQLTEVKYLLKHSATPAGEASNFTSVVLEPNAILTEQGFKPSF